MTPKKPAKKATPKPPVDQVEAPPQTSPRPGYLAFLIVGLALLGAATTMAVLGLLYDQEEQAFNLINHAHLPAWVTSQLAHPLSDAVWGIIALVGVLFIVPKFRLVAWQYIMAGLLAYGIVFAIEHLVDRARPPGLESYEVIQRLAADGPGFPSTHVGIMAALGLTLWLFVSWPWRIGVVVLIAAEAWSRMFLGVHTLLDVIGGLAVAMVIVAGLRVLPLKVRKFLRIAG